MGPPERTIAPLKLGYFLRLPLRWCYGVMLHDLAWRCVFDLPGMTGRARLALFLRQFSAVGTGVAVEKESQLLVC